MFCFSGFCCAVAVDEIRPTSTQASTRNNPDRVRARSLHRIQPPILSAFAANLMLFTLLCQPQFFLAVKFFLAVRWQALTALAYFSLLTFLAVDASPPRD